MNYLRIALRYKWRILVFAALFGLLGWLATTRMTPIYMANLKLQAEPIDQSLPGTPRFQNYALVWLFYETQREIISSRRVALEVVDALGLVAEQRAQSAAKKDGKNETSTVFGLDWTLWLPEAWREKPAKPETDEEIRQSLAERISSKVRVSVAKNSQILVVSYTDKDPKRATRIVNAIADAYQTFGLTARKSTAKEQSSFLNQQLRELKAKVAAAEKALQAYQEKEGLIDTASRQQIVTAQLSGLSTQLIAAEAARSEAEIRYREVERLRKSGGEYESIAAVLKSEHVSRLREQVAQQQRKVSELAGRYGRKHPKMISARSDLVEAQRALDDSVRKVVGSLKQEYQVALQQERKIKSLMSKRKREIQGLRGRGFELAKLEREAQNAREVYTQFLTKLRESDVASDYDVSNVRIIDPATEPKRPYKPNKIRITVMFAFGGMLLGFLLGLWRERSDKTFKLLEQVEEKLAVPGLGIVPLVRKADKASVPERASEKSPTAPFAEAINHIRTGILFSDIDQPPQVVLVTSSVASEGKTTLASNLAASFSQIGRTLLVECDLRKPRMSTFYSLADHGLTDAVREPEQIQECVVRVDSEKDLWVLPAGSELADPLRFLSSKSFAKLVLAMRNKFTHIVLDAPPVIPVSDAIVLSRLVDEVVLALRAEATTERTVRETVKRLRNAKKGPLGVILTMVNPRRADHYGKHYYGDGSGHGYGYGERYGYGYGGAKKKPATDVA